MLYLVSLNRPVPVTLAERFAYLIDTIRQAIGHRAARHPAAAGMLTQLSLYFQRANSRLGTLLARLQAGTVRPPRPRAARISAEAARPEPPPRLPPPRLPPPRLRLPRRRAWLIDLVPPPPMVGNPIAACRETLQRLLTDPEMVALIAAAPQAGRVLRPLCHALGLDQIPEALRLPPRPPRPPDPERQAAQAARAEARAARRAEARAEAAWARAFRRSLGLPARPPDDAPRITPRARPPPKPA